MENITETVNEMLWLHALWVAKLDGGKQAQFCGLDLRGFDFSGHRLDRATFDNCVLTRACFEGVTGDQVSFVGCEMSQANFRQFQGNLCLFRRCVLSDARFDDARMNQLTIHDTQCDRARFCNAVFEHAWVEKSSFLWANFIDVSVLASHIEYSNLGQANLDWVSLASTTLIACDLRGASVNGTDFTKSYIGRCTLADMDTSSAVLTGAQIRNSVGDGKRIRSIAGVLHNGVTWGVTVWDSMMSIGCQVHTIGDWYAFDDATIAAMHKDALPWWKANKGFIQQFIRIGS